MSSTNQCLLNLKGVKDPDSLVSDAKRAKDVKEFSKLVQNGTWTAKVIASACCLCESTGVNETPRTFPLNHAAPRDVI